MKTKLVLPLLVVLLLAACNETKQDTSASGNHSSQKEITEETHGLEEIFSKDLEEIEASDWDNVYISKDDFEKFVNEFPDSEHNEIGIKSGKMIDHETLEFIFDASAENEIVQGFTIYFFDSLVRTLYLHSGFFDDHQPIISYKNADGSLITELEDYIDMETEETSEEETDGESKPLTEVGDSTIGDDGSTVTLKKILSLNESFDYGPLTLEIKDLKILEISNASQAQLNDANEYAKHEITDPFYYLQVTYSAKNQSDNLITWNGFEKVVFNNGQQLDVSINSFANGRDWDTDYYGGVFKDEHFGAIIDGTHEDIEWVKLVTSHVYDGDFERITDGKEHDFNFE